MEFTSELKLHEIVNWPLDSGFGVGLGDGANVVVGFWLGGLECDSLRFSQ